MLQKKYLKKWKKLYNKKEVITQKEVRISIMKRKNKLVVIFFVLFLLFFIMWSNNHVVITRENIYIDYLPVELEGFTILQITDLHEKKFGKNQEELTKVVNSLDYDAIVFTGDMLKNPESKNHEPFYKLIEGISNKGIAFFVPGNTDPKSYVFDKDYSSERDEMVIGMEQRGVKLLETIEAIEFNGASIHFAYLENVILKSDSEKVPNYKQPISLLENIQPDDVLIALNHFPLSDERANRIIKKDESLNNKIDLIIAGHYHGGQIRLPFIGALFIPEPSYGWEGFFPPQDRVKGFWEYKGFKQYVSAGLGSSNAVPFLKFRLFNPPEINYLILKRGQQ